VVVHVRRTWPHEVDAKKYGVKAWDKSDARFQAEHEQPFTIVVAE
jgi:hypothetical protein